VAWSLVPVVLAAIVLRNTGDSSSDSDRFNRGAGDRHPYLRHFLVPETDRASAKRWLLDACIQAGCYENAMNCRTEEDC